LLSACAKLFMPKVLVWKIDKPICFLQHVIRRKSA
jgi:hypothetical protein